MVKISPNFLKLIFLESDKQVSNFLSKLDLLKYYDVFLEYGWDDLEILQG